MEANASAAAAESEAETTASMPKVLLSCIACKNRKVRCDRARPTCAHCRRKSIHCAYPERVKTRAPRSKNKTSTVALDDLFQRLSRLEQNATALPQSTVDIRQHVAQERVESSSVSYDVSEKLSGRLSIGQALELSTSITSDFDINPTAAISDSIAQIQKFKTRQLEIPLIKDALDIPSDLAKQWISNYFTYMPSDLFLSLVNRRLIEIIPDLDGLPFIYVEPSILVLYYGILYCGCAIGASTTISSHGISWATMCYIGCLRAMVGWQRQATGTTEDFIAAVFLTRISCDYFDFDLSWKMFSQACEYARKIGLHNLDGLQNTRHTGIHAIVTDDNRRGFWQLLQFELFFRLVMDKPPSFTVEGWQVNLPRVLIESAATSVPTLCFLVGSRMSMAQVRFFQLLEDDTIDQKELLSKTTEICIEASQTIEEWQMDTFLSSLRLNVVDYAFVLDTLVIHYYSIIFMLAKASNQGHVDIQPGADFALPSSILVLDTCRKILKMSITALSVSMYPKTIDNLLGFPNSWVPLAWLYTSLLQNPQSKHSQACLKDLEEYASQIHKVVQLCPEYQPFLHAIRALNDDVAKKAKSVDVTPRPDDVEINEWPVSRQ